MATFSYPANDLDRARNLLAVLGSFWADLYAGRDQLLAYTTARAQVARQSLQDLLELMQSVSRYKVPIYHKDLWYALRLRQSQMNTDPTAFLAYDGSMNYDQGYRYNAPLSRNTYSFPVDATLAAAPLILNRLTEPSLVWHDGIDYRLDTDNHALILNMNPFADARVPSVPIFTNGVITDQEATLWVFHGDFDWDTVYRQFGYVLGMRLKSSTGYRDLLNAVFETIVSGCAGHQVELGIAALSGIPLVLEPTETVATVTNDDGGVLIITDQHVYRFAAGSTPSVAAGDVVHAGASLTDALAIIELNRGQVPAGLNALALGKGMLAACFYQDLIFENRDVALEVITDDPSGFTKLRFALGGLPLDVDRFFDLLHQRGVDESLRPVDPCNPGRTVSRLGDDCDPDNPTQTFRRGTLAHLLDVRANPTGEPTAAQLPATINPLQFLIQNVLRHNAFIVRVKAPLLGPGAVGLYHARWLRRLCPPQTALLLLIDLSPQRESILPEQVGEALSTFTGMEPLETTVPNTMVAEQISIRTITGSCQ